MRAARAPLLAVAAEDADAETVADDADAAETAVSRSRSPLAIPEAAGAPAVVPVLIEGRIETLSCPVRAGIFTSRFAATKRLSSELLLLLVLLPPLLPPPPELTNLRRRI